MSAIIATTQVGGSATFNVSFQAAVLSATGLSGVEEATVEYSGDGVNFNTLSNDDETNATLKIGRLQMPLIYPGLYKVTLPATVSPASVNLVFKQ